MLGGPPQSPGSGVEPGMVVDGYIVGRELGRGGMARVFEAHDSHGHRVALKVLLPDAASRADTVERFEREGRVLKKLSNEHIARILDVGELIDGTPYHVIELLTGTDLRAVLQQRGPLDVPEATDYVIQACAGVGAAHEQGILHRDVKPANLFRVASPPGKHTIKVLDFGVAKVLADSVAVSLTQTADLLGSPHYIAPEQFRDSSSVTAATDIWSLGVVLFTLLTDRCPFEGDTLPQLCMAILNDAPRSVVDLRPRCPPALDAVIKRCLEKDPQSRYRSTRELARALERFRWNIPKVYDSTSSLSTELTVPTGPPSIVRKSYDAPPQGPTDEDNATTAPIDRRELAAALVTQESTSIMKLSEVSGARPAPSAPHTGDRQWSSAPTNATHATGPPPPVRPISTAPPPFLPNPGAASPVARRTYPSNPAVDVNAASANCASSAPPPRTDTTTAPPPPLRRDGLGTGWLVALLVFALTLVAAAGYLFLRRAGYIVDR